jgi:flavin-dependent dehydrogenase
LDRAAEAGCAIVQGRVTGFDAGGNRTRVEFAGSVQEFDFAVIAAGARSALLPATDTQAGANVPPLAHEDLEITLGYYIPIESSVMKIKFVPGLQGYVWSFPRPGHLSVGVCASMAKHSMREAREILTAFISEEKLDTANTTLYSHLLPSPRAETLRNRVVAGANWAIIGDAAAFVDPVTGEGIYYAMRSGEVLASALVAGNAAAYPTLIHAAFRDELEQAANLSNRFYNGTFLGGAITTRMIGFARHSETFRHTLADIFAGSQSYRALKTRLWRQLGVTLAESAGSLLRSGKITTEAPTT